jgi:hypothetical protein
MALPCAADGEAAVPLAKDARVSGKGPRPRGPRPIGEEAALCKVWPPLALGGADCGNCGIMQSLTRAVGRHRSAMFLIAHGRRYP